MAQGMSDRDIARHWQITPAAMSEFLTQLRRRKDPPDPTLPQAITVIRWEEVPTLLLQLARGLPTAEIARRWRVNAKALSGFFRRIQAHGLRLERFCNTPLSCRC
jgi:hypothetical protein